LKTKSYKQWTTITAIVSPPVLRITSSPNVPHWKLLPDQSGDIFNILLNNVDKMTNVQLIL